MIALEWIQGLFSGVPGDMSRIGVWGLVLMAVGVADILSARKVADRWAKEDKRETIAMGLKLGGLLLVVIGFLGAVKAIG